MGCAVFMNWYRRSSWRNPSVFSWSPSKTVGSFPWRDSSSPWIGIGCGRGPGDGPLDGGSPPGGVGGDRDVCGIGGEGDCFGSLKCHRIGVGVVPNRFHVSNFHASVLLTEGGDMLSAGGGIGLGSGFGVLVGNSIGSSFIGVDGLVITNLHSYGNSVGHGLVGLGVGSAWNMHLRRSSVQYRSNSVDWCGSSSLFIRATGST